VLAYLDQAATVQMQVFNADGSARSLRIALGQAEGRGNDPVVAMDAQGNFVVAWTSGPPAAITAQRFDADGDPLGGPFQVNQNTTSYQVYVAVAMDPAGDFVVAWMSNHPEATGWQIEARHYGATGQALADEFKVNTTGFNVAGAGVAMDGAGNFVVNWRGGDQHNRYMRRFSAAGAALDAQDVQVNTAPVTPNSLPLPQHRVAMDANGNFVVVWEADDGMGTGVFARRYAASGQPQSDPFQVNTVTPGGQIFSRLAMDAQGDLAVTWTNDKTFAVSARLYSPSGQAISGELQVNQGNADFGLFSDVAVDAQGNATFAWNASSSPHNQPFNLGDMRQYTPDSAGYSYDPGTATLTISGGNGNNQSFAFSEASHVVAGGALLADYTFNVNGVARTYNDVALAQVNVYFPGSGNSATLMTNDTYLDNNGVAHETSELAILSFLGGSLYRVDASGTHGFLSLYGFQTMYAYLGKADNGELIGSGTKNLVVTAGSYSYMSTLADSSLFSLISGGASVYAYASPSGDAQVWHYDTNAMDAFVSSGNAYSYMSGTDNGQAFFNVAVGFNTTYAFSQYRKSVAYLIDSPGNDVFYGSTSYSYMYGTNNQQFYFDEVQGFALVYAESFNGGTDYAYNYDPHHNILTGNWIRLA
jgi:hypothetical protein